MEYEEYVIGRHFSKVHMSYRGNSKPVEGPDEDEPALELPNGFQASVTTSPSRDGTHDSHQGTYCSNRITGCEPSEKKDQGPAGGFDGTEIPYHRPGYTLKITAHRAENLPIGDINTLSSDPYVLMRIITDLPTRHKEDPPLVMRTFTHRRTTNPVWNADWVVGNVPFSGFRLKCRLFDEDPGDHDDKLGDVEIEVASLDETWEGFSQRAFRIKKRHGSKRAYAVQAVATAIRKRYRMTGTLTMSIKMIGRTRTAHGGRVFTMGPMWWTRHYSPLLGRIVHKTTPKVEAEDSGKQVRRIKKRSSASRPERYNFQANQMQLHGPVPAELYHRYVEFKPFVKGMFTKSGIRGFFLHKALEHQHDQIYRFDGTTDFGYLSVDPSPETTLKFLDLVHFDKGGRIFTYILTLDSLLRFTETGKEFKIDLLSKHTMHSDVSIYVAFSGEFFVRRLKNPDEPPPEAGGNNQSHPPDAIEGGPPKEDPPHDPRYYELVIDNSSGTYRPLAELLPKFREFLEYNLPGLKIVTLDCKADAELLERSKREQRERKAREGQAIVFKQVHRDDSSIASSDEEALDRLTGGASAEDGDERREFLNTMKRDLADRGKSKRRHWKGLQRGRDALYHPENRATSAKGEGGVVNGHREETIRRSRSVG